MTDAQAAELAAYLRSYTQAVSSGQSPSAAVVFFAYYRLPVLLTVLALIPWGVWLVLPLMTVHGFLLSLTVRSITAALGRSGLSVALAALGIRCCFVLPCCFCLASLALARGRKSGGAPPDREGVRRLALSALGCAAALLLGCAAEISLVPRLFSWALARIS